MKKIFLSITAVTLVCFAILFVKVANAKEACKRLAPRGNIKDHSWTGLINHKTHFFMHYQIYFDSIVTGEIVYTHASDKRPIKLIGTKDRENNFGLNEFDKKGNITGVLNFTIKDGKVISGVWTSTKNAGSAGADDSFDMSMEPKDTSIDSPDKISAMHDNIFGSYYYQYGENGYQGSMDFYKIGSDKIALEASCITNAPARNVAEIERDTVALNGNEFIYSIPNEDGTGNPCILKINFYKDFIVAKYIKGDCLHVGGMNSSLEGIFYKIK